MKTMRTVKEISDLTGISVRTLHYYDEIGLLKPTEKSEARYRLYDDKALETLQQILFFREFDIPLKEIKTIMENPALDRSQQPRCKHTGHQASSDASIGVCDPRGSRQMPASSHLARCSRESDFKNAEENADSKKGTHTASDCQH